MLPKKIGRGKRPWEILVARIPEPWRPVVAVAAILLAMAAASASPVTAAVWEIGNAGVLLSALLWGIFHPRAVAPALPLALRWSFWLSLLGVVLGAAYLPNLAAESIREEISGSLVLLASGVFFILFFIGGIVVGMTGAMVGAFAVRRTRTPEAGARTGVVILWCLCAAAGLLLSDLPPWRSSLLGAAALWGTSPLAAYMAVRWHLTRRARPEAVLPIVTRWLERALVFRPRIAGTQRMVDLRGAVLGGVASLTLIGLSLGNFLTPLRSLALVQLIQFRNEHMPRPLSHKLANLSLVQAEESAPQRRHLVLAEIDPEIRRRAATESSEAAVQAEVIRALGKHGASLVVLPLPRLQPDWDQGEAATLDAPRPDPDRVDPNVRDLPILCSAMRKAGNVALAFHLPRGDAAQTMHSSDGQPSLNLTTETRGRMEQLVQAARFAGPEDLDWFGSVRLPAIRLDARPGSRLGTTFSQPPLPVELFAARRRLPIGRPPRPRDRVATVAGARMPLIAPELVLVDYVGNNPGHDFPRVSYGGILRGDPLFVEDSHAEQAGRRHGRWETPDEYFPGKIVFLEPLEPQRLETPVGKLTRTELLMNATSTLLCGAFIAPVGGWRVPIWTTLLCMLIGLICTRLSPFAAGWRVALALLAIQLAVVGFFVVRGVWIDPVVVTFAVLLSYVLCTQLTFSLEQHERQRNRAMLERFVAPQVVEELLGRFDELGVGGTRREICVLFADARNFTGFAESHSPEEVIEVINRYMGAMTDILFMYEGMLDKYTGDGLMALFSVGENTADDVSRAVHAAIDMQEAVSSVTEQLLEQGKEPLRIGIGMHFGEAVVGLVGHQDRVNYTALGHAVVVSARLQTPANSGEVVVSDAVMQLVGDRFRAVQDAPVHVKGIKDPVHPYRVLEPLRLPPGA